MQIHQTFYSKAIYEPNITCSADTHYCYYLFKGASQMLGPWKPFTAPEGFLALLRPGQRVQVNRLAPYLLFDLLEFTPEGEELRLINELPLPTSPTIPPNIPELSNRLRVITEVFFSADKYRREKNNADFLLLLYGTSSGDEAPDDTSREKQLYREMRRLRTMISDDPLQFRTVQEAAEYMHLSTSYFSSLYKDYFGISFGQDLIRSRVKRCCMLLMTTDNTVTRIAQQLGYRNEAFFYHQFRQVTGMTPGEYRQQHTMSL